MAEKKIQKANFRSLRMKAIAEAVERGDRNHNIWTAYSAKTKKDCVLLGDVEYLNFHWMEGDPAVADFSVDSDLYIADGDESHGATYPDAIATLRDGTVQWREAKALEDDAGSRRDERQKIIQERITNELGYSYLRVTPALLKKHWQFICNWRRATAFCSAARHISTSQFEDEACALIGVRQSVRLLEVTQGYEATAQPLVVAAILRCAQLGRISTDLEKLPLGPRTLLEAPWSNRE